MASVTGDGSLVISGASLAGSGVKGIVASGALLASESVLSGTGKRRITGAGGLVIAESTITSTGKRRVFGTGILLAITPQLDVVASMPDNRTWEGAGSDTWGDANIAYSEAKPVMIVDNLFFQADNGVTFDGLPVMVMLSRTGLTIFGKARDNTWKVDPTSIKEAIGIYPVMRGAPGTIVQISLGSQDAPNDPVLWEGPRDFTIGQDFFLDFTVSGRYIAVKFESRGQEPWELLGYDLDVNIIGGR